MSKPKEFKLSQIHTNEIILIQQAHQSVIATILSVLAHDMGYKVSNQTQFKLSDDYSTLTCSELEMPKSDDPAIIKA